MDEILLYLSLKHKGEWMAIYDSLQKREELSARDIEKAVDEVDCKFVTLINDDYVNNLKTIYKPPFGIFCYGDYSLLNKNIVTVYADDIENNKYLQALRAEGINLLWVDVSNKQMVSILTIMPSNNIFYMPEAKNTANRTYQNILCNPDLVRANAFVSEIWERRKEVDYSNQLQERMYLGLSKQVLVLKKLKARELLALSQYCMNEDIHVVFLDSVLDEKTKKLFAKSKLSIITSPDQVIAMFGSKN